MREDPSSEKKCKMCFSLAKNFRSERQTSLSVYLMSRDVLDTTLPDTGFNWIAIYRIHRIVRSLNVRVRE